MNKIMSGFLVSIMALPVFATDLADLRLHIMNTFTDSAQTHYPNGTFNRYSNAQVLGDEDSRLDFKSDNNHWGDNFSCGAKKCEITGSVRDPVSLPDFQLSNESKNYSSYDECKKGNDTLKKFSYGNVEVGGCSVKFPSGLKARNVQVNSDGIITLEQGFYWFESFTLNNSAKLEIDGPVTIFVKNNFHLNSDALVNIEGETQDLLFVSYSEDNIAMDNKARLNGFIYAEGNLQLNGSASIAGRVNLNNLTLNNKSIIEGASSVVDAGSGTLHHYELHFNSCNADLTVKACGDENCSVNNLYSDKATVHVKNQVHPPKNLYKFKDFNGQASTSIAKEANQLNYYFELGYQTTGKGNLSPKPLNDLVCYVDGIRTCKVNGQSNGSGSGPLTLKVDTAFAADNAPISFSGNCLASNATVEVEFGFDSSASGFAGPVTIHWPGHVETLNTGQKKPLILPVSGATLSYPRADLLTLSARKVLPEGGYAGDAVTDLVAFVPASWKVQQEVNCGDNNGFKYNDPDANCTVLGAAGSAVDFSVAALDVKGSKLPLDWLKGQRDLTQQVEVNLENGGGETQTGTFGINSQGSTLSQHQFGSKIVGRLGIRLPDWTAQYIPGNDSPLVTQGHQAFVGRTVPASLHVTATAGDIEGDVVYAGKSGIVFLTKPSFTVTGLDTEGNKLPSYSGEFAGGLKGNATLELDTALDLEILAPTITEAETGKHVISVDTSKVKFIKTEPFAETELDLPLELTINDHDGTQGVYDANTLAQENDTLRFGFVTLMDTEIKVGEVGAMASKLHYFGNNLQTVREDKKTGYDFAEASGVRHEPVPDPELKLGLVEHEVTVAPYGKQQKNIKVTIENLPVWLKPEQDGSLIDPEARLDILNQPRKRGNDSTFNRREVIR